MKHPVSVAELLELHRLGELFLKWTATPFAMLEQDLQELQEIADRYHINHSSALFSFQRKYQQDMAISVEQTIDEAIEAIPGLAQALSMVPTTSLLDRPMHPREREMLQGAMDRVDPPEYVRDSDGVVKPTAFAQPTGAEMDEALLEQLHEDNEIDREEQAAYHAEQLREQLAGDDVPAVEREIEILKQISNVDELTPEESARLDELVSRKVSAMNCGAHSVPAGVVQDAISTGHIEKIK